MGTKVLKIRAAEIWTAAEITKLFLQTTDHKPKTRYFCRMAGVYVHIPFCRKACHYCNFHFSTNVTSLPEMTAAIIAEAALRKDYLQETVNTVYFGGGTPSLLEAADLKRIIDALRLNFDVAGNAEITLEANPDDITVDRLADWRDVGINRLSIGVQSFFDEDLLWMNRAHNAVQAAVALGKAREFGFSNITIDLIYGVPGLTDERWKTNVVKAVSSGVTHLSCYALTVEPKTALEKMIALHKMEDVDPDQQARQFQLLCTWLEEAGFEHYELSNFAKPGFRSRHNSSYWQGKPYLGLGPSAHSFNGESRQWNIANNAQYLQSIKEGLVPFEKEILTPTQQLNEYLMTALRTVEGISVGTIEERWGKSVRSSVLMRAKKHIDINHLALAGDTILLTREGKFLADGIASDLFEA
jgi:oxygen-independent coproporphyrinogen-3 oxidase